MMKKLCLPVLALFVFGFISGCAVPKPPTPEPEEVIMWQSEKPRPKWTYEEPYPSGKTLVFVGLSRKVATETDARDQAYHHAIDRVVDYIGRFGSDYFEELVTSYKLSKDIVDPTIATRNFKKHLSGAIARKVKATRWYLEKWQDKFREVYWKVIVLCRVPEETVDDPYDKTCDEQLERLRKERDKASEEKAKRQFENAMDAFKKAKEEGFPGIE